MKIYKNLKKYCLFRRTHSARCDHKQNKHKKCKKAYCPYFKPLGITFPKEDEKISLYPYNCQKWPSTQPSIKVRTPEGLIPLNKWKPKK